MTFMYKCGDLVIITDDPNEFIRESNHQHRIKNKKTKIKRIRKNIKKRK